MQSGMSGVVQNPQVKPILNNMMNQGQPQQVAHGGMNQPGNTMMNQPMPAIMPINQPGNNMPMPINQPMPAVMPTAPTAPAPNINTTAAQGINTAIQGSTNQIGFQPGQLATTNLDPYMNPYQQNVIDKSIADINRQGSQMQNTLGAQASAANAFGGSRHGIAEGELGRNILQSVADTTTGLNQQGFTQAQGAAQTDIANQMQGAQHNLNAAGQLGSLSNLGFGMGQTVSNNLAQQGALQQGTNQALIDAIKGQFGGYSGAGAEGLGWLSQALGATTVPQTQTDTKQPGLFDYLTLAMS